MNEESGFHRALAENPDDRIAKGAYADWLAEQGHPAFAEVVRGNPKSPAYDATYYNTHGPLHPEHDRAVVFTSGPRISTVTAAVIPPANRRTWLQFETGFRNEEVTPLLRRLRDEGVRIITNHPQDRAALREHLDAKPEEVDQAAAATTERLSRRHKSTVDPLSTVMRDPTTLAKYGRAMVAAVAGMQDRARKARVGSVRRYSATEGDVKNLLGQIATNPEHRVPGSNLRLVAADALQEQGRDREADVLRNHPHGVQIYEGRVAREFPLEQHHRDTALAWHGGGGSPLYQIGSTGRVTGDTARRTLGELDDIRNDDAGNTGLDDPNTRYGFDQLYNRLARIERQTEDEEDDREQHDDYEPPGTPTGGPNSPGGEYYSRRGAVRRYAGGERLPSDPRHPLHDWMNVGVDTPGGMGDEPEDYPEEPEPDIDEPTEGDYHVHTVGNEHHVYQDNHRVLRFPISEEPGPHIRTHADSEQFWPNAWMHYGPGNYDLITYTRDHSSRRLSSKKYAAYRAPAGGAVVRGTSYRGGEMIPDLTGEFANPPIRKAEGEGNVPDPTVSYGGNNLPKSPGESPENDYGERARTIERWRSRFRQRQFAKKQLTPPHSVSTVTASPTLTRRSRMNAVMKFSESERKSFLDQLANNENDTITRKVFADWLEENEPDTSPEVLNTLRNHEGRLWVGLSPKGRVNAIPRLSKEILDQRAAASPWGTPSGEFYHSTSRNNKGQAHRVRVSGKMKTWKSRPTEFRVPWKFGMYDNGEFNHNNVHEWLVDDPTAEPGV